MFLKGCIIAFFCGCVAGALAMRALQWYHEGRERKNENSVEMEIYRQYIDNRYMVRPEMTVDELKELLVRKPSSVRYMPGKTVMTYTTSFNCFSDVYFFINGKLDNWTIYA